MNFVNEYDISGAAQHYAVGRLLTFPAQGDIIKLIFNFTVA